MTFSVPRLRDAILSSAAAGCHSQFRGCGMPFAEEAQRSLLNDIAAARESWHFGASTPPSPAIHRWSRLETILRDQDRAEKGRAMMQDLSPGYTQLSAALGERYRVERELGRGGMATVYLAHDLKHDRKVAINV